MTLNALNLAVDTAAVDTIKFQGGGGDSVTLTGGAAADTMALMPGSGTLTGVGYAVQVSGASTIVVNGGANDTATLQNAPTATSQFIGTPGESFMQNMTGTAFLEDVRGFGTVVATGGAGDLARLFGSPNATNTNQFVGTPGESFLQNMTGTAFLEDVRGFGVVAATGGAADLAKLFGSPTPTNTNQFVGTPGESFLQNLTGTAFLEDVRGFGVVAATGGTGDLAKLFGSPTPTNTNQFVGTPGESFLQNLMGTAFLEDVRGFGTVLASGKAGDVAKLFGSATANNLFVGTAGESFMQNQTGAAFLEDVRGFGTVIATGGANDTARLFDAPASSNVFVAQAPAAFMQYLGSGVLNYATGFGMVVANASAGSYDIAHFFYQSDNTFGGFFVQGPGYDYRALGPWQDQATLF
jgi:hypothetical protein